MTTSLGIIAGGGPLPAQVVAACRALDRPCFVLALEGQCDAESIASAPHAWARLGAVGRMLSALHGAAVDEVVMVGPVRRPSLAELRPDARALRELARIGGARGDDHLLSAITTLLEREGFRVIGVDQVVHGLTVKPGLLGQRRPDRTARQDISRGIMAARSLGVADIGQAVVVQDGIVLAAEAAEGTTAMVRRAGDLARAGRGGVLVKTVKPGQNRRVDLPTIGPETLEAAATAGLRGIMIEANGVLVLERARCIAMADDAGLFLLSEAVGPA